MLEYAPDSWKVYKSNTTPKNTSHSGYGSKLPTSYMIKDSAGTTRRVYAICWSNAASFYCLVKGEKLFIQDWRLSND